VFRFRKFVLRHAVGHLDGGRLSQGLCCHKEMQINLHKHELWERVQNPQYRHSSYKYNRRESAIFDDKIFHSVEVCYIKVAQNSKHLVYKNHTEPFQGLELLQERIEKMCPFVSQGNVSSEIDKCKTPVEEISKKMWVLFNFGSDKGNIIE
jgi:hypothetical protein